MDVPREILYKKINENMIKMIKKGWKNELEGFLLEDKNIMHLTALKATGYHEIYLSIIHNEKINVDLIAQKTRHYAKRQIK